MVGSLHSRVCGPLAAPGPSPHAPLVITPRGGSAPCIPPGPWPWCPRSDPRSQATVSCPNTRSFHDTRGSQLSWLGFPCRCSAEAEVGEGGVSPQASVRASAGQTLALLPGLHQVTSRELLYSSGLDHSSVIPDTCPFGKGSGGNTRSVGERGGVEGRRRAGRGLKVLSRAVAGISCTWQP